MPDYRSTAEFTDPIIAPRGYPTDRTLAGVIATAADHIVVGLGFAAVVAGVALLCWFLMRWFSVGAPFFEVGAGAAAVAFLLATGCWAIWHAGQDEWLRRHDRHEWAKRDAQLAAAAARIEELEKEIAERQKEVNQASVAYGHLNQRFGDALRAEESTRRRNAELEGARRTVHERETDVQRAARAIIEKWELGLSHSRDVICEGGRIPQEAWAKAFDIWEGRGLAVFRGNRRAIADTAVAANLYIAVGLTPPPPAALSFES